MAEKVAHWGLTAEQAKAKLAEFGPNEVIPRQLNRFFSEIKKILLDPMGLMLLLLGGLYWILGDRTDSVVLFCAFIPVTAVDVLLEVRSGRILSALRTTLAPTSKVYRDNIIIELPIREIVPDDVLVFEEGQTLPADGVLAEAENLSINEAALTGESIPVEKNKEDSFFGGTIVLSGRGLGLVQKTGRQSKYGMIALMLSEIKSLQSPLQRKVAHFVKIAIAVAAAIAVVLFITEWRHTEKLIPSLIVALTLGMAAVPEEFPLVLTLYLSLGAWRLSKKGLLVKSLPCVETLGGVDVICTDKTGTLTEGLFQLEEIKKINSAYSEGELWKFALLACEIHIVDSIEIAILKKGVEFKNLIQDWELLHDYPFELQGKHMSHVWKNISSGETLIAMKGAMEGVLEHCAIDKDSAAQIESINVALASSGKRVLGLAGRAGACTGDRLIDEKNLNFLGFFVFTDPIRSTVKNAIFQCQQDGIDIKILTGDHLLTAHTVADEIGLSHSHHRLFTGQMLSQMSETEKEKAYTEGAIFARVLPEQKHEMVQALQKAGKIVAMTGDGVNDAPALKLADIGISMGKSATDVARATAKIVLLKNDFSGIVEAVFEGRKIFSNLQRSFSYLISFHIPIVLLAMIPSFLGWPSLLLPVHIILLELIVHPISAFTFENIEGKHLPKNPKGALLTRGQLLDAIIPGLLLSLVTLWLFGENLKLSPETARTLAFESVLFGNIFFVLAEVAPKFNRRFFITIILLITSSIILVMNPIAAQFLHFSSLSLKQLLVPGALGALASIFRLKKLFLKT